MALPYITIHNSIKRFGNKRTKRVGEASRWSNDVMGQSDWLALMLRETLCKNIESHATDDSGKPNDTGIAQINRFFNEEALREMEAVLHGTYAPVVPGANPYQRGYCPTLDETLRWLNRRFTLVQRQARQDYVALSDLKRFVFSSHNAGYSGALNGYREGDSDKYTTGGEYGLWCVATSRRVKRWLSLHPNWKA